MTSQCKPALMPSVVLGVSTRKGFPAQPCLPLGPLASTILVQKEAHLLQRNCSSAISAENLPVSLEYEVRSKRRNIIKDPRSTVDIFNGCCYLFLRVFYAFICFYPLLSVCLLTIRVFTTLQSEPRDLLPLRYLIRVMSRHNI